MPKVKIVTVFTPDILPYAKYNVASVGEYALRHGYDYELRVIDNEFLTTYTAHWAKVDIIQKLLGQSDHDWFFVLDADTLIIEPSIKLESFLPTYTTGGLPPWFIGICDDSPNGGEINTGSMFVYNDHEFMYDMVREWMQTGLELGLQKKKYHEQDTLRHLMHASRKWKDAVKVFPATAFNGIYNKPEESEFIAHYMALPLHQKASLMNQKWEQMNSV